MADQPNDPETNAADPEGADDRRVQGRADTLLPEELEAESDDPVAQAGQILAESDERLAAGSDDPDVERRQSQDTVEPVD